MYIVYSFCLLVKAVREYVGFESFAQGGCNMSISTYYTMRCVVLYVQHTHRTMYVSTRHDTTSARIKPRSNVVCFLAICDRGHGFALQTTTATKKYENDVRKLHETGSLFVSCSFRLWTSQSRRRFIREREIETVYCLATLASNTQHNC